MALSCFHNQVHANESVPAVRKMAGFFFKRQAAMEDAYRFDKSVGKNGFSELWLARNRRKPKEDPLAIRLMCKETCSTAVIATEITVLKSVSNCSFVVKMHSCFQTPSHYAIVMKFATRGTLHERVKMVRCFSELVARFYAAEISEGIFILHNKGMIHRDLNMDNILVCENGHVVLSNFGNCLLRDPEEIDAPTSDPWPDPKTKPFLPAPEFYLGLDYDKTVDWWSLGVIIYRMVCGEYPFSECRKMVGSFPDLDVVYRQEPYPMYLSMPVKQLISQLLARKRLRRLGAGKYEESAISGAPFFYHVDWSQIRDYTFPAPFSELVHPAYHREGSRRAAMHLPVSYMGPIASKTFPGGEKLSVCPSIQKWTLDPKGLMPGASNQRMSFMHKTRSWIGNKIIGDGVA